MSAEATLGEDEDAVRLLYLHDAKGTFHLFLSFSSAFSRVFNFDSLARRSVDLYGETNRRLFFAPRVALAVYSKKIGLADGSEFVGEEKATARAKVRRAILDTCFSRLEARAATTSTTARVFTYGRSDEFIEIDPRSVNIASRIYPLFFLEHAVYDYRSDAAFSPVVPLILRKMRCARAIG